MPDVDQRGEVLAEHRDGQGRPRPRSRALRSVGEQFVAALELLHGDGDVALLQCRGGPPQGPLAVAQVAVGLTMATTAPRMATPARMPSATAIRRTDRRASRPRRDKPVVTMTAAISAVTRADSPKRDGSQRNKALIVSAADSARPARRSASPITAAIAKRRRRRSPTAATRRDRGEAGGDGERPPRARRAAHATKPAKQAVSTTSAGRHAVGCARQRPRRQRPRRRSRRRRSSRAR